jgi:hypothetical protein
MDETPEALEHATQLVKTGRLEDAKTSLLQYLRNNPNSEQAWLLMSYTVSDTAQQKDCLERVLRINPENAMARSKLTILSNPVPAPATASKPALPREAIFPLATPVVEKPILEPVSSSYFSTNDSREEEMGNTLLTKNVESEKNRLTKLRSRVQNENAQAPISGAQLFNSGGFASDTPSPTEAHSMHSSFEPQDDSEVRKTLPLRGILIGVVALLFIGLFFLSGGYQILIASSTPTPTPTETPIVVSLPPEWTKTPAPTDTITPTITITPSPTFTPSLTLAISLTPTRSK